MVLRILRHVENSQNVQPKTKSSLIFAKNAEIQRAILPSHLSNISRQGGSHRTPSAEYMASFSSYLLFLLRCQAWKWSQTLQGWKSKGIACSLYIPAIRLSSLLLDNTLSINRWEKNDNISANFFSLLRWTTSSHCQNMRHSGPEKPIPCWL